MNGSKFPGQVTAYLCALKVKRADLFDLVANNVAAGHQEAAKMVVNWTRDDPEEWMWRALYAVHQFHREDVNTIPDKEDRESIGRLGMTQLHFQKTPGEWLRFLARRLDLPTPE